MIFYVCDSNTGWQGMTNRTILSGAAVKQSLFWHNSELLVRINTPLY